MEKWRIQYGTARIRYTHGQAANARKDEEVGEYNLADRYM